MPIESQNSSKKTEKYWYCLRQGFAGIERENTQAAML
jgi:hypothetical protein